ADILYTNQPGLEIMKEINSNDEHEIIIRTRQIVNSDKVEVFDIKIGEKCYSITLRAVKDTDYVNVYGKDITDKIQAKEELVNLNNSLEDRVKQRTLELEKEIQERRKAEELLRESEMKYRELVESANSIIIRWNYRGEIIFYNDFAEKKFGYRPEEILGRNILETIVPEEEEGGRNLRSVMFDIIENPDKYIWHINENVKKNGKKMWVAWANRAIYDKYGKVREILSIGNDISRQKYAEEQLKLSKKEAEDKAKKLSKMYSRIQSELELARKIQTKILPSVDTFHSDKLEYYYEYQPLEEVGGDFFDIDEIADGIFRVMITDATGHGIQAGLITMAIKSEYEELKWKVADPATVLEELGYRFTYKFSALNIILPCIVIDINSIQDTITYASAGYPRQILLQNGNPLWLERTEPIIGLNRNRMLVKKKESRTYKYRPGDILFLFSDGLTETRNPEKKIFGDERLLDMIHHLKENSIKDSINYIFSGIEEFRKEEPLRDDITILGIHRL
ncbi:MAG: SpoIIE family protein phosphatase, partial [Leptospiraceae bacterium]|nr:SpoIIE family protein phosphatase [Leptospiraceae bacterium]